MGDCPPDEDQDAGSANAATARPVSASKTWSGRVEPARKEREGEKVDAQDDQRLADHCLAREYTLQMP